MKNLILVIVAILSNSILVAQVPDSLIRHFTYDTNAPLNLKVVHAFRFFTQDVPLNRVNNRTSRGAKSHVDVREINFESVNRFKVSAWVTVPISRDSVQHHSLIIFQHWGEGTKDEFLSEAIEMSARGFICVTIDAPYNCPDSPYRSLFEDVDPIFTLGVINVRRALNYVAAAYRIDARKIFYVGHSYGASVGAILSALEPRISAFVLMTGVYSFSKVLTTETSPRTVEFRENNPKEFDGHVREMSTFDADRYIPFAQAKIFLQLAKQDEYIPLAVSRKYEQLLPDAKVQYYATRHGLNNRARKNRLRYLLILNRK